MSWDERQRAMLQAMGLRVWDRGVGVGVDAPSAETQATGAAAVPASPPATLPRESHPGPPSPSAPADAGVDAARAATIATLGWDELRESVARCRACGLCEGRQQTVFGSGARNAHWLVVGEAPGEQEDASGEPFVGPAGKLLDNMLAALDLTRRQDAEPQRQVYIANTVKCRPPRNRNPEPAELAQCAPFLQRQIELLRPRIILAMGRFAVQSLLHSGEAIGRLRGRVHRVQDLPLIVTYHPAYLLRTPADKARAWEDLRLAHATLDALPPP